MIFRRTLEFTKMKHVSPGGWVSTSIRGGGGGGGGRERRAWLFERGEFARRTDERHVRVLFQVSWREKIAAGDEFEFPYVCGLREKKVVWKEEIN